MTYVAVCADRTSKGVDHIEEFAKRHPAMALMSALFHLAGPHRQERLHAVQRLDLRVFIDAEHRRMRRRVQIQPDDIPHLPNEQRVGRKT